MFSLTTQLENSSGTATSLACVKRKCPPQHSDEVGGQRLRRTGHRRATLPPPRSPCRRWLPARLTLKASTGAPVPLVHFRWTTPKEAHGMISIFQERLRWEQDTNSGVSAASDGSELDATLSLDRPTPTPSLTMLLSRVAWPSTSLTALPAVSLGNPTSVSNPATWPRDSQIWASGQHAYHYTMICLHKYRLNLGSFFSNLTLHLFFCLGANFDPVSLSIPLTQPIHWVLQISFLYTSQICPLLIIFLDITFILVCLKIASDLFLTYLPLPPPNQSVPQPEDFSINTEIWSCHSVAFNSFPTKPPN